MFGFMDIYIPTHQSIPYYPSTTPQFTVHVDTTFGSKKRLETDKMGFPKLFAHSVKTFSEHSGTQIRTAAAID